MGGYPDQAAFCGVSYPCHRVGDVEAMVYAQISALIMYGIDSMGCSVCVYGACGLTQVLHCEWYSLLGIAEVPPS